MFVLSTVTVERVMTPSSTVTVSITPVPPPNTTAAVSGAASAVTVAAPAVTVTATAGCAVCGAQGATRSVTRSRAHHYGLREGTDTNNYERTNSHRRV